MKIKANTKSVEIIDSEKLTSGGFNDLTIDVELSEEYQGLTTFVTFDRTKTLVIDNKVMLPTLKAGKCRIGVYAIYNHNSEIDLRYSPAPAYIYVSNGSYKDNYYTENEEIAISEAENIYRLVSEAIDKAIVAAGEKVKSYSDLLDKPTVNGKTFSGDMDLDYLGIQPKLSDAQVSDINSIQDKENKSIIDTKSNYVINLQNNVEYRRGTLSIISINYPSTINEKFFSTVVFYSGANPTTFNCDTRIKLVGSDVESNVFSPEANKTYELRFWWNGRNLNCVVWGV